MQLINEYNIIKRTLFYCSKMFLKQLVKGEDYSLLNNTITINLLNFNCFDSEQFHNIYHMYEDETKELLSDILEVHFIELKKFEDQEGDRADKLNRWLNFINNPNDEEVKEMAMIDTEINKAKEILSYISADKELQILADAREKAVLDEISRINGARREGIKEGIIEVIIKNLSEIGQISSELINKIKRKIM